MGKICYLHLLTLKRTATNYIAGIFFLQFTKSNQGKDNFFGVIFSRKNTKSAERPHFLSFLTPFHLAHKSLEMKIKIIQKMVQFHIQIYRLHKRTPSFHMKEQISVLNINFEICKNRNDQAGNLPIMF